MKAFRMENGDFSKVFILEEIRKFFLKAFPMKIYRFIP